MLSNMSTYMLICIFIIGIIKIVCKNKCYMDLGFFELDEEFKKEHDIHENIYFFSCLIMYILALMQLFMVILTSISQLFLIIIIVTIFYVRNQENFKKETTNEPPSSNHT